MIYRFTEQLMQQFVCCTAESHTNNNDWVEYSNHTHTWSPAAAAAVPLLSLPPNKNEVKWNEEKAANSKKWGERLHPPPSSQSSQSSIHSLLCLANKMRRRRRKVLQFVIAFLLFSFSFLLLRLFLYLSLSLSEKRCWLLANGVPWSDQLHRLATDLLLLRYLSLFGTSPLLVLVAFFHFLVILSKNEKTAKTSIEEVKKKGATLCWQQIVQPIRVQRQARRF